MPKNQEKRIQSILSIEKIYKHYREYKYLPETKVFCQLKHKSAQLIAWPEAGNWGFSVRHYLNKPEFDHLNRIVTMYLDFAELQAVRNIPMYMKDWIEKLNAFLQFSEYAILTNAGSISHEVALALANKEYEIFKKDQDKNYISDFDREIKLLLDKKGDGNDHE